MKLSADLKVVIICEVPDMMKVPLDASPFSFLNQDFTRPWFENSQYADKIDFRIGDALEHLPEMDVMFDLAFIDGDKRKYVDYYNMVMQHMSAGGYMLADNTLWDGHVADPAYDKDAQTVGIRDFNDLVAHDDRVEKVILPLRDGLTIIRKK